jgi:AcrR family transcriptional regulator
MPVMPPSPTGAPRRTQAERTATSAERLRRALAELIAEQGYERTTAAQIGERAGYSRAMVRERYGSKDALLAALHRSYEDALLSDDGGTASGSGLERALAGVDRLHAFASEHPVLLRAIFVASFEAAGAARAVRPTVLRWLDELGERARTWLTAGIADGSVRRELDVDAEVERFLDAAIAGAYRWVVAPDAVDYPERLRAWRATMAARWAA